MTEELVLSEQRGAVLVLTFNRPRVLNAWTNELEDQYYDFLAVADEDPSVRAIVVTGSGRGFCSGADLGNLKNVAKSPKVILSGRETVISRPPSASR